jgi:hypothetical protein
MEAENSFVHFIKPNSFYYQWVVWLQFMGSIFLHWFTGSGKCFVCSILLMSHMLVSYWIKCYRNVVSLIISESMPEENNQAGAHNLKVLDIEK